MLCLLSLVACRPDPTYVYEVNPVSVTADNEYKNREKTQDQYIATLYANLFQKSISGDEMAEIRDALFSIGDKELGRQMMIARLLNDPAILLPSQAEMQADLDQFIIDTYHRFLVREPTEAEKVYWRSFLDRNPNLTPDMVYLSFILSNEYQFY